MALPMTVTWSGTSADVEPRLLLPSVPERWQRTAASRTARPGPSPPVTPRPKRRHLVDCSGGSRHILDQSVGRMVGIVVDVGCLQCKRLSDIITL